MDREGFWKIINIAALKPAQRLPADDHYAEFIDSLKSVLENREPQELEAFQDHLQVVAGDAYTSEMYGAHNLVNGGGSLDGFYYFRAWLVAQGKQVYDAALANPDSLADVCALAGIVADYECEDLLIVARDLFSTKTGRDMSWRSDPGDLDQPMPGADWADEDELRALLPRLAAIHLS